MRKHAIDRYGRTVAQVFVDGKDVGLEMLRQGFAWVYDRYITEASTEVQETYRKAQKEAKAEQTRIVERSKFYSAVDISKLGQGQ